MLKWIIIFILVPVSMIVSPVIAEENRYKQRPVISLHIQIPPKVSERYLWKSNPSECLVALEIIPVTGCGKSIGVIPFVSVANRQEIIKTGRHAEYEEIKAEAVICICKSHKGNRIQYMRAKDEKGTMQLIWTNPEVLNKKKPKKEIKPPPPESVA